MKERLKVKTKENNKLHQELAKLSFNKISVITFFSQRIVDYRKLSTIELLSLFNKVSDLELLTKTPHTKKYSEELKSSLENISNLILKNKKVEGFTPYIQSLRSIINSISLNLKLEEIDPLLKEMLENRVELGIKNFTIYFISIKFFEGNEANLLIMDSIITAPLKNLRVEIEKNASSEIIFREIDKLIEKAKDKMK